MSPRKTFHNCSSSSSEVRRRKRQNQGIRRSSATLHRVADSCASAGRCVRNFSSVNGAPSLPMRSCRNTTPGPPTTRSTAAQASSSGLSSSNSAPDTVTSSTLFPAPPGRRAPVGRRRQENPASRSRPGYDRPGQARPGYVTSGYEGESASSSHTTHPDSASARSNGPCRVSTDG